MKITSKTLYAIKFMVNLASNYDVRTMSVAEVAGLESISEKFLENIVASLKARGLIKVRRGAKGGYSLAKSPLKTNLKEIIESVETDKFAFSWEGNENSPIEISLHEIFADLNQINIKYLESKNLEDILNQIESKKAGQMFYI